MVKNHERLFLFLILLLALILRLVDIDFLLPYFEYGADERLFVEHALQILKTGDWNPHLFIYGSFPFYLTAFIYLIYLGVQSLFNPENFAGLLQQASFSSGNFTFLYLGRLSSVAFGLGTIWISYRIAKKIWNRETGYLAALLLALNPFHIFMSQYFRVDAPLLFWILAAFYFSLRVFQDGKTADYLLAGFFSGLAISTKYAFPVFLPLLAAHILKPRAHGSLRQVLLDWKIYLSSYVMVLTFLVTSPYAFLDFPTFIGHIGSLMSFYEQNTIFFRLNPANIFYQRYIYQLIILLPLILGIPTYILAFPGTWTLIKSTPRSGILLLVFPFTYFLISSSASSMVNFQYLIPTLPFAVFAASYLTTALMSHPKSLDRKLGWTFLLVLLLYPATNLVIPQVKTLFSTYEQAGEWIESNLPKNTRTAIYFWIIRPSDRLYSPEWKIFPYANDLNLDRVLSQDPEAIVLTYSTIFSDPRWREEFGGYLNLYQYLESGGSGNFQKIKEFRPPRIWSGIAGRVYPEFKDFRISIFRRTGPGKIPLSP